MRICPRAHVPPVDFNALCRLAERDGGRDGRVARGRGDGRLDGVHAAQVRELEQLARGDGGASASPAPRMTNTRKRIAPGSGASARPIVAATSRDTLSRAVRQPSGQASASPLSLPAQQ